MFPVSPRCAFLREEAVNQKTYMKLWYAQRNVYFTIGRTEALRAGKTESESVAAGISTALERFTPVIIPGELIVGFNYGEAACPEYYYPPDSDDGRRVMRENGISPEDIERYFDAVKNPAVPSTPPASVSFTEEEKQAEWEWSAIGRCIDSNHSVLGYEAVLKKGFSGLLEEVEEAERKNGPCPLYESAKRICLSAAGMGEKYARKAAELLESGDSGYRAEDLREIIEICSRVPREPARSFAEAIQALWFAHIVNTWEDTINANSVGRLDQILYPYYAADIEKGILRRSGPSSCSAASGSSSTAITTCSSPVSAAPPRTGSPR